MKALLGSILVTVYGLTLRLLFGFFDGAMGIMSLAFLALVPLLIGFLTVILSPNAEEMTTGAAFFKPWLTCIVLLVVTIIFSVEGAICWVMIFPFFAFAAGVGGLIALAVKRKQKRNNNDDWHKPTTLKVSFFLLLPLLAGYVEADRTLSEEVIESTEEVTLAATPAAVWQRLTHINGIQPSERSSSVVSLLGFPHHVRTTIDSLQTGGHRNAYYEKGLTFYETITACMPAQNLTLDIKTNPQEIASSVLDEHIVIGGKHVRMLNDTYDLTPVTGGTRLRLTSRYAINTPINWYAGIWARVLMSSILRGELRLIKKRCG